MMKTGTKTSTGQVTESKPRPRVVERRLVLAKRLASQNGGKLPSPWKLIQSGEGGLYRYMLRNPNLFVGIPREAIITRNRNVPSINETIKNKHLATIKRLTKKYGKLPDQAWLSDHGHNKLVAYMKNHPQCFVGVV